MAEVLESLTSRLPGGADALPEGGNPFWFPKLPAIESQSTSALYQCESDDESGVMKILVLESIDKLVCVVDVQTTQQRNNQQSLLLFAVHQQTTL